MAPRHKSTHLLWYLIKGSGTCYNPGRKGPMEELVVPSNEKNRQMKDREISQYGMYPLTREVWKSLSSSSSVIIDLRLFTSNFSVHKPGLARQSTHTLLLVGYGNNLTEFPNWTWNDWGGPWTNTSAMIINLSVLTQVFLVHLFPLLSCFPIIFSAGTPASLFENPTLLSFCQPFFPGAVDWRCLDATFFSDWVKSNSKLDGPLGKRMQLAHGFRYKHYLEIDCPASFTSKSVPPLPITLNKMITYEIKFAPFFQTLLFFLNSGPWTM